MMIRLARRLSDARFRTTICSPQCATRCCSWPTAPSCRRRRPSRARCVSLARRSIDSPFRPNGPNGPNGPRCRTPRRLTSKSRTPRRLTPPPPTRARLCGLLCGLGGGGGDCSKEADGEAALPPPRRRRIGGIVAPRARRPTAERTARDMGERVVGAAVARAHRVQAPALVRAPALVG